MTIARWGLTIKVEMKSQIPPQKNTNFVGVNRRFLQTKRAVDRCDLTRRGVWRGEAASGHPGKQLAINARRRGQMKLTWSV